MIKNLKPIFKVRLYFLLNYNLIKLFERILRNKNSKKKKKKDRYFDLSINKNMFSFMYTDSIEFLSLFFFLPKAQRHRRRSQGFAFHQVIPRSKPVTGYRQCSLVG